MLFRSALGRAARLAAHERAEEADVGGDLQARLTLFPFMGSEGEMD